MTAFKRIALIFSTFFAAGLCFAAPASAQATRTWISGVGDDANPCSRTAPCKTFGGAIAKTAGGGEINCLDPGGFGSLTITKSIAIICENNPQAGVLVAATNAIIINVPAGTYVTISGLYVDGLGSTGVAGVNGIYVLQGGNVTLRNMTIGGFRNGYGVNFVNTQAGKLIMDNVSVIEGGIVSDTLTGGVLVQPAAGITADVTIVNSRLLNNQNIGLRLDTVNIIGSVINATVDNTTIAGNTNGILLKSPPSTGTIKLILDHSVVSNSSSFGLIVNGTGSTARVGNSLISNNLTGVAALQSGSLFSYGNNQLDGNGTDGAFTSLIPNK
ncbi:hypothetical protein QH494_18740 [Sphingomonas sp. AR_OL41]|uniref:hypothetical protein n=1 Tax=Sphingomonas sp. AR_OL41 TaxID=3042729 RepID=UPI0024814C5F|nr:hypothetical protein [Sphingomonas sp. AR_OL41]MDH7974230.1 hypothetical protein [Sphingomonas sp. AR_OL41]